MSTIQNLFQQAQLAEAAYADFFINGVLARDDNSVKAALSVEGFSTAQATAFINDWSARLRGPRLRGLPSNLQMTTFS